MAGMGRQPLEQWQIDLNNEMAAEKKAKKAKAEAARMAKAKTDANKTASPMAKVKKSAFAPKKPDKIAAAIAEENRRRRIGANPIAAGIDALFGGK